VSLHGFNTRCDPAIEGLAQMFVTCESSQVLDGRDDHRVLQKLGIIDRPGTRMRPLDRNLDYRNNKTMFSAAVSKADFHNAILLFDYSNFRLFAIAAI
jgi:hypothetical protein